VSNRFNNNRNLIIIGLRRSGTTAFWNSFRQDKRFLCFNEPFNPQIIKLKDDKWPNKFHYKEFATLINADACSFWKHYVPIFPCNEFQYGLSDKEKKYLLYLADKSERVCVDTTRCHFKIKDLYEIMPNSVLVHLYRPPSAFVSSIMIPSLSNLITENKLKKLYYLIRNKVINFGKKKNFWKRKDCSNAWSYDEIIGVPNYSIFYCHVKKHGYDPESIHIQSAIEKLLLLWKICFQQVEQDGKKYFKEKYFSVNFHDFCKTPNSIMEKIYSSLNLPFDHLNFDWLRKPNLGYDINNPLWKLYKEKFSIPID